MGEAELPALNQEVVVPTDADHMFRGDFSKPEVNIIESLPVVMLEAAKISAVD